MTEELKPCPFCGCANIAIDRRPIRVRCTNCEAENPPIWDTDRAKKEWNTRPVEDALRERVKRLEEALERVMAQGVEPENEHASFRLGKCYHIAKKALEEKHD